MMLNRTIMNTNITNTGELKNFFANLDKRAIETTVYLKVLFDVNENVKIAGLNGTPFMLGCRELVKFTDRGNYDAVLELIEEWKRINRQNGALLDKLIFSRFKLKSEGCPEIYELINIILETTKGCLEIQKATGFPNRSFKIESSQVILEQSRLDSAVKNIAAKTSYDSDMVSHILKWLLEMPQEPERVNSLSFPCYNSKQSNVFKLILKIFPGGNGGIFPDPATQMFIRYDKVDKIVCKIRNHLRGSPLYDILNKSYITWSIKGHNSDVYLDHIRDESLGAAFAAGVINLLEGRKTDPDICISAAIDEQGELQPVSKIESKYEAARRAGSRVFITSVENYRDICRLSLGKTRLMQARSIAEIEEITSNGIEALHQYLDILKREICMTPGYYPSNSNFEDLRVDIRLKETSGGDSRKMSAIFFPDNAPVYGRCFILGDPGFGKTWFLEYRCLKNIDSIFENINQGMAGSSSVNLPLFIRLSELSDYIRPDAGLEDALLKLIKDKYLNSIDKFPEQLILEKMLSGKASLYLDGLDEISSDRYALTTEKLKTFLNKYHRLNIIVSSRKWNFSFPASSFGLKLFEILPLDKDHIETFIDLWFTGITGINRQKILSDIESTNSTLDLCSIPLMLSFVCRITRQVMYTK